MEGKRAGFSVLFVLAAGLTAGCAGVAESEAQRLSLACQFSRCDCVSGSFFFDGEPVLWRADGSAYCRDGYYLRRLESS